ncbi:MAG TPA: DUF2304 domain-containing protein [Phototrophicaceae bacterium]|nr:DUF2304 domain-containing protein [Phototrophicaceae bacterium]
MPDRATLFGLAASIAGLIFVLELVRQRKLREDYSLLWLATAVVLIVLSLSRPLLNDLAALLGIITYPPAALFLVAIIFMLVILLHFSTVLTRLARENKEIAQQMAILRWELSEAQRRLGEGTGDDQNQHQGDHVQG